MQPSFCLAHIVIIIIIIIIVATSSTWNLASRPELFSPKPLSHSRSAWVWALTVWTDRLVYPLAIPLLRVQPATMPRPLLGVGPQTAFPSFSSIVLSCTIMVIAVLCVAEVVHSQLLQEHFVVYGVKRNSCSPKALPRCRSRVA